MTDCITVTTVQDWYANNCTQSAMGQGESFYTSLYNNFFTDGQLWVPGINNPTDDQLAFQTLLIDLCNSVGEGACNMPTSSLCAQYSREDTTNPVIRQFCGCYLPTSQYNSSLPRSCDTVCSSFDNLKYFPNAESTTPEQCTSNICVIDNVTIEATNSTVGNISFSQICPFCSSGESCACIISDIDIVARDSQLGGTEIQQNCTSVECFTSPPGQGQTSVPCSPYLSGFGLSASQITRERTRTLAAIIILIILAVILFLLLIFSLRIFFKETSKSTSLTSTK